MTPDEAADYTDCFALSLSTPDDRTAEQWARASLEEMPSALRRMVVFVHRHVLRFRLGPLEAADHVLGWRVVSADPDVIRLEADGPLVRGVLVGTRETPLSMVLRSYVFFRRGRFSRLTWVLVGPIHRRVAPYLLRRAAHR